MLADECAGVGQRPAARLEPRVPQRPCMDHVRPDFERDGDFGGAGRGREA
jgi:hypothetical protein